MKFIKIAGLLAIAVTLCSLFLFEQHSTAAPKESTKEKHDAKTFIKSMENVQFRKEFGLNHQPEHVQKVLSEVQNESAVEKYGVVLTEAEEQEIERRGNIQEKHLPKIKEKLDKNLDKIGFGGIYIDQQENGKVMVGVKKPLNDQQVAKLIADIKQEYPYPNGIEFYNVTYSEKDLNKIADKISTKHNQLLKQGIEITSVSTDFENQSVIVSVTSLNEEAKKSIKQTAEVENLSFIEGGKVELASRSSYHDPLQGGLSISGPKGQCSMAYLARNNTGKHYAVTAAHCGNSGDSFYQGGSYMGYISNSYHQLGGEVDATGVYIANRRDVSSRVYGSVYLLTSLETWSGESIGQMVCKSGASTGTTCGTLQSKRVDFYSNGIYHYNFRGTSGMDVISGDSGGTVYYRNSLKGVVLGYSNLYDGIYSHARNVLEDVGLIPILD
ncbi:S1 family peptidase [Bacillus taeanensis]|uniref:S1 family peptidase n=1 Tax=Bacillus taeanensis TaxID=273032 RepID=A0A366XQJ6_9BACI|nr:S1 family peptidase [Bacillus taeanensis]RBW67986.1 hypothetical protein DS031_18780 [Bacillus taeanensis]